MASKVGLRQAVSPVRGSWTSRNLIPNSSFDTNTGYSLVNGATVTYYGPTSGVGRVAPGSLRVVTNGTTDCGVQIPVTCLPNTTYTLSAWLYTETSFPVYMQLSDNTAQGLGTASITVPANTWFRISGTVGPTNANTARYFHVYTGAGVNAIFWLDDVQLEQGSLLTDYDSNHHIGRTVGYGVANWVVNPYANNDVVGFSAWNGSTGVAPTRVTGDVPLSRFTAAAEVVMATSDAGSHGCLLGPYSSNAPSGAIMPVNPGQTVRGSIWAKFVSIDAASTVSNLACHFRYIKANGSYLGEYTSGTLIASPVAGTWYQLNGTHVVPAGAAYAEITAYWTQAGTTNPNTVHVTGGCIMDDGLLPQGIWYVDGNDPGYSWSGAAGVSRSVVGFAPLRRGFARKDSVNKIPDPGFDKGISNWAVNGAGANTWDQTFSRSGKASLRCDIVTASGVAGSDGTALASGSQVIGSFANGDRANVRVWVWSNAALPLTLQLLFRNSSLAIVTSFQTNYTLVPNQWNPLTISAVATDPTTSTASLKVVTTGTATTGTFWVDDTELYKSPQGRIWAGGMNTIPDGDWESGQLDLSGSGYWSPHAYQGTAAGPPTGVREVTNANPHTGTFSLHLHKDAGTTSDQEFGIFHSYGKSGLPAGRYRIGGWLWCDHANVAQIQGNWSGSYVSGSNGGLVNQWMWCEFFVDYNPSASAAIRLFIAGTTAAVDAYFDGVYMIPVAGGMRGTLNNASSNHAGNIQTVPHAIQGTKVQIPIVTKSWYRTRPIGVYVSNTDTGGTLFSVPAHPEGLAVCCTSALADTITVKHPNDPTKTKYIQLVPNAPTWIVITPDYKNIVTDDYTVVASTANVQLMAVSNV